MDITPQVINEVEFHQKMRGYDPDEVDDFLERVAVAVGQLQDKVRELGDRAAVADRRSIELENRVREMQAKAPAAPAEPTVSTEEQERERAEAVTRTIILAQRTADAAIQEAQETAAHTVQAAQEQAQRVYAEAQDEARTLVVEAEAEARKSADETRQRLVSEIIALEEHRDSIRGDHGALERSIEEHRTKLRNSIGDLQRLLDDQARLKPVPAPELTDAPRPAFLDEELRDGGDVDAEIDDDVLDARVDSEIDDEVDNGPALDDVDDDDDIPVSRPITGGVTFTLPPDQSENVSERVDPEAEERAWARFADDAGPPTQALDFNEAGGDDTYLTELRNAMLDDTSAPRNQSPFDDRTSDDRSRSWFGRKR